MNHSKSSEHTRKSGCLKKVCVDKYHFKVDRMGRDKMTHYMNLWDDSFQAIKEGWKTIEMRLNDEKRSMIKVDDIIEFTNTSNQEKLSCKVINIYKYSDFSELYENHDKQSIGYRENEKADPNDMLLYYAKEQIEKYGVVGIELTKLNKSTD